MTTLRSIAPAGGPPAKGPYSPAIRAGNLLFVSGQIAVAADGSSLADADLATQTRQCLANLRAVLEAGGASLHHVAKVTVYLADPDGWPVFNPIYAEFFGTHKPARAIVPVAAFPGGFKVEVDAIAVVADPPLIDP
jgi:2-iminobutanoate/2-iminopropanoate deaminase